MDILEAALVRRQLELWSKITELYDVDERLNKQVRIWIHEKSVADNAYIVAKKRYDAEMRHKNKYKS